MIDIRHVVTDILHSGVHSNEHTITTVHPSREVGNSFTKSHQLNASVKKLQNLVNVYEKDLRFYLSDDLNKVIVKVVNSNTERVIKEIPSELVQQMLLRIHAALGVIVDDLI